MNYKLLVVCSTDSGVCTEVIEYSSRASADGVYYILCLHKRDHLNNTAISDVVRLY